MKAPQQLARVFGSPTSGVFATYSSSGYHFERHWHDTFGVGLLDRGAQSWASRTGRVDAYEGDVINTNPGEVHDGRPLGAPSRQWRIVSIDPSLMHAATGHGCRLAEITRPVIADRALARALRRLFARIERWNVSRCSLHVLAFEESLVESCVLLMAVHGTEPVDDALVAVDVRPVRDRLADDASRCPPLAELAAMMGLSRFQLLRRFTAQFGMPPHAWVRCRRAERARGLIRDGTPLARAAAATGFADQSHMTRAFVRQYGYTPGAWRRAVGPPQ